MVSTLKNIWQTVACQELNGWAMHRILTAKCNEADMYIVSSGVLYSKNSVLHLSVCLCKPTTHKSCLFESA